MTYQSHRREYVAGLRRRRTYADNARLLWCGRCTDPWTCRCYDGPITDRQADAAIEAAEHLEQLGIPGIFDRPTCQAMWRRGRRDLSVRCYAYSHGEAA